MYIIALDLYLDFISVKQHEGYFNDGAFLLPKGSRAESVIR